MLKLFGYAFASIFFAGIIWGNVSGFDGRIHDLEIDNQHVKETIAAMKQHIDDLWHDNGHKE